MSLGHRLLHEAPPRVHHAHGILEVERPARDERCVLAEAVTGDEVGANRRLLLQGSQQRHARGQDRRLLDLRAQKVVFRAFEAELRQCEAEHLIRRIEGASGSIGRLVDIAAHADLLGTLAGKEQREHPC